MWETWSVKKQHSQFHAIFQPKPPCLYLSTRLWEAQRLKEMYEILNHTQVLSNENLSHLSSAVPAAPCPGTSFGKQILNFENGFLFPGIWIAVWLLERPISCSTFCAVNQQEGEDHRREVEGRNCCVLFAHSDFHICLPLRLHVAEWELQEIISTT